ncbi:DegT/DnrJ/EryC1/StrS family aminotransferase [Zavarzinia sp. CC-PAN008]|uniref:DegT/DnrJ/EryC1/StrS family aminotransferase n=1 Tax=Zavarzinia sp. CC-PAN008 TaxID=3243332 RepID=UPI003F749981
MAVHLFVPHFSVEECLEEVRACLERGWTGAGYKTLEFEAEWCRQTGLAHAHFLNSATAGLHLALEVLKRRLGWAAGDEVISTPLTFVSTNHAILHAGLRPVMADVDRFLCLDPDAVAARLSPRTRAVMFVGFGGTAGRYAAVRDLCRARGIALILDAAHMAGTRLDGAHVGHDADAAVFSFHAVKNLPTGDSGAVCFAQGVDDAAARRLSWLGIDKDTYARTQSDATYRWRYDVADTGFKYHGNSIMAAIALVQLRHLERDNARRRQLAARYRARLAEDPRVTLQPEAPDCVPSGHLFPIRVDRRDDLMAWLNAREVYPGVHYRDNTEYPMYADQAGHCPAARAASLSLISLPLHLGLDEATVDHVAGLVRQGLDAVGAAPAVAS